MEDNEVRLIDINLNLISKCEFNFSKYSLIDLNGRESDGGFVRDMIYILEIYDLISVNGDFITLSKFGKEIIREYGSWGNYLDKKALIDAKSDKLQENNYWIANIDRNWKIPSIVLGILGFCSVIFFGIKGLPTRLDKEEPINQQENIETYKNKEKLKKEEVLQEQLKDSILFQTTESK